MLLQISIQNFILIEKAIIHFGPGLNVVSGETGAGKSIFLAALNATLGEKISSDQILPGKDVLKIISVFDISSDAVVKTMLDELGIDYEEDQLSLRREISLGGKSKCYINNILSKNSHLKALATHLIDIHGQHQNQHLFQVRNHQKLLDAYLGLNEMLDQYRNFYFSLLQEKKKLIHLYEDEKSIAKEKEFLKFTVNELDHALMPEDEYDRLKDQLKKMESYEQRSQHLYQSLTILGNETIPSIQKTQESLTDLSHLDANAKTLLKQAGDILYQIENFKHSIESLQTEKSAHSNLDEINLRLANVERVRKKYAKPITYLFEELSEAKSKLTRLENMVVEKEDTLKAIESFEKKAMDLATQLHMARKKGVGILARKLKSEIDFLGMEESVIEIALRVVESQEGVLVREKKAKLNDTGLDEIEFMYGPTQKAGLKKLREIASGGEISRLMLAFKAILFENLPLHTMVFDEIDTGIGGNTAINVGKKIKDLSSRRQLIVITHLPQIAKFSDTHFQVAKIREGENVNTRITILDEDQKTAEIARMIGGEGPEKDQLTYARSYIKSN